MTPQHPLTPQVILPLLLFFPCLQILSGMYPISQVQEPYTAVGYLAARVPLVDLLQLVHPLNRADSDDDGGTTGDQNHPWSAWDVCDGKIKPKLTSASSVSFFEQC